MFFCAAGDTFATSRSASTMFFSGTVDTISDSTEVGDSTFEIITADSQTWVAVWDFSSMTFLEDYSLWSYDSDTDTYEAELYYETSSTDGFVFANMVQQVDSEVKFVTISDDGGYVAVENSTYLNTLSDSLIVRVYWKGTVGGVPVVELISSKITVDLSNATYTTDDYFIQFYQPANASSSAYTYRIDSNSDVKIEVNSDGLNALLAYIVEAVSEVDSSSSISLETIEGTIDQLTGDIEDVASEIYASVLLSTKTEYYSTFNALLAILNDITVSDIPSAVGTTTGEGSLLDLSLTGLNDYSMDNGLNEVYPLMDFKFDGLDLTSVNNASFIEKSVSYAIAKQGGSSKSLDMSLSTGDFDSLTDLLDLSDDDADQGLASQASFNVTLAPGNAYNVYISGTITDPSLVEDYQPSALLSDGATQALDDNDHWFLTWVGTVNAQNEPWFYSLALGWIYELERTGWYYADTGSYHGWLYTHPELSTEGGFWLYLVSESPDWYFVSTQ